MGRAWFALAAIAVVAAGVVTWRWLRDPGPPGVLPARAASESRSASERTPAAPALAPAAPDKSAAPVATPERRPASAWPQQFGRVVAADDRSPIADAWIGAPLRVPLPGNPDAEAFALDDLDELATCDEAGRFMLLPELPHAVLVVMASGFGSVLCDRSWLGDSAEAPLEIALARAATLQGTVVDPGGAPLAGVDVALIAFASLATATRDRDDSRLLDEVAVLRGRTDGRGRVDFDGVPAHVPFQAHLGRDEMLRLVDPTPIELDAGETATREWQLATGAMVNGRAIDADGKAVANLELTLLEIAVARRTGLPDAKLARRSVPRSDADGRFALADVLPGSWLLRSGLLPSTTELDGALPSVVRVEVEEGAEQVEVLLKIRRGPSIRGRVLTPDGARARATLDVRGLESGPLPYLASATDGEGSFALGPFEGGSYELVAEPLDPRFARSEARRVEPGRDDVVLRLRAAAAVRPRAVRKSDGEPVSADFALFAEDDTTPLPLTSLPPGRYDLVATGVDGSIGFERAFDLREGADRDVRVEMVPGARLVLQGSRPQGDREPYRLLAGTFCFASGDVEGAQRLELVVPAAPIRLARAAGFDPPDLELDLKPGETRELAWPPTKK